MIKYYPKLVLSFSEIAGAPTLIIHALTGCTFHCYQCFNFNDIVKNNGDNAYSIFDVVEYIDKQQALFGYLVFSGGEFLNASINDLIHDLTLVRAHCHRPIIVYTNGAHPAKMRLLTERKLVDGFHTDFKLPYHLLEPSDHDLIELALGVQVDDPAKYFAPHLESLELTVAFDQGHSRIRSVRYPFMSASAFVENQKYIDKLNRRYRQSTPYDCNPFVYPEEKPDIA